MGRGKASKHRNGDMQSKDAAPQSSGRETRRFVLLSVLGFIGGLALAMVVVSPFTGSKTSSGRDGVSPQKPSPDATGREPTATARPVEKAPDALADDPDMRAGQEALRLDQPSEAIERFDAAHRRHPNRPEPLLALARVFLKYGYSEEALAASHMACSAAPENVDCHVVFGQAMEALGERERAATAYAKAAALDPKDPQPPYHLARLADARTQTEVAVRYYRQALAADPGFAPAAHYLAKQLMGAGRFDEAERLLSDALGRNPDDTNLLSNLALTHLRKGDAAEAVKQFQAVLPQVPDKPLPHYHLGCALVLLERDEEAVRAFQLALSCDPCLPGAWYALAQCHKRRGRTAEAKQALAEFAEARAMASAIRNLRQQLSNRPTDVAILVELGALLLKRGKLSEAYDSLDRAVKLDPRNQRARSLLQQVVEEAEKHDSRSPGATAGNAQ